MQKTPACRMDVDDSRVNWWKTSRDLKHVPSNQDKLQPLQPIRGYETELNSKDHPNYLSDWYFIGDCTRV